MSLTHNEKFRQIVDIASQKYPWFWCGIALEEECQDDPLCITHHMILYANISEIVRHCDPLNFASCEYLRKYVLKDLKAQLISDVIAQQQQQNTMSNS